MDNRYTTAQEDENKHLTVTRTVSSPPKYDNSLTSNTKDEESTAKSNSNILGDIKLVGYMSRSETCLLNPTDRKLTPDLLTGKSQNSTSNSFYSLPKRKKGKLPKWISLELIRTDDLENQKIKIPNKNSSHSKSDNQIYVKERAKEINSLPNSQKPERKDLSKRSDNFISKSTKKKFKAPSIKPASLNLNQQQNKMSEKPMETQSPVIETQYPLIIQWPPPRKINRSETNYVKRENVSRRRERKNVSSTQDVKSYSKSTQCPSNPQETHKNPTKSFNPETIWHKSRSLECLPSYRHNETGVDKSKKLKKDAIHFKKTHEMYQEPLPGNSGMRSPIGEARIGNIRANCKECTFFVGHLKEEGVISRRFLQKNDLSESSSQESVGHRSRLDRMRDFIERNKEVNSVDRLPKNDSAFLFNSHKRDLYFAQQIASEQEEKQNQALNKWFSDNQDYGGYSDASHEDYCSESDTRTLQDGVASIDCPNNLKFSYLEENNDETKWNYDQALRKYEGKRVSSMYSNILSQASTDSEGREEVESDATSNMDPKTSRTLVPLTKLDPENELACEALMLGEFFPCTNMAPRNASPVPYGIDSDSGDRSAPRSPYVPRRFSTRPLRGPYGEMLEAEMSKSKPNSQFLGEELHLNVCDERPQSVRSTSPQSPILMIPKDQCMMLESPAILVSEDLLENKNQMNFMASPCFDEGSHFMQDGTTENNGDQLISRDKTSSPGFMSEDEKRGELLSIGPIPLHQRTASSPSKLCFENESEEAIKTFKEFALLAEDSSPNELLKLKAKRPKSQEYGKVGKEEGTLQEFPPAGGREKPEREVKRHPSSAQQQKKGANDTEHIRSLSEHRHGHRRYRDTRNHVVCELRDTEANYVRNLSFLLNKYEYTLRSSEYCGIVDPSVVDAIFYQVPEIHTHHVKMLEDLKRRMEPPVEENICVGDILLKTFKEPRVLESYSNFINNWKNAQEAAKATAQAKPAFKHFLLAMSREHPGKRELKSLLIMPVQRFPRYELLLKRLLEHTCRDHPDFSPLKETIITVQKIANILNNIEQEALKQEQQQFILKEIEASIEGIVELQQPDRTFIQVDQVSQHSNLGMRKERCLFLFSDLLVITSVKRRSTSARKITCLQPVLLNFLESSKFKLFKFIPLDDIEIGRSREESLKRKFMRELEALEQDVQTLQQVTRLVKTLHFPKGSLEEAISELDASLKKQYLDRQRADSHLSELELTISTAEGVEVMGFIFHKPEAKDQWEEAFNSAKQRQAQSADRRPPPEFVIALPIRKTRAGLQFTCAAAILSHNAHNLRDVWVCNSDGYVGQVCVMSLQPEPTLASCIGVCNARIMSIASVPSAPLKSSISVQRFSCRYSSDEEDEEDLSLSDDVHKKRRSESLPPEINLEESENQQPTMWLGTEDGSIIVYNCSDTIRTKRNKFKFQPGSPVHCIIHVENKVFASLANGNVIVYERDYQGSWNGGRRQIVSLSTAVHPVTRMVVAAGRLWCSVANGIKVINPNSLLVEHTFTVGDEDKSISCMVSAGYGVWMALTGSASVKLLHASTFELVCDVAITSPVTKMLAGSDDIIRQHKAACLRVTALLPCKDLLWIGTSAGVIITIPLPHLTHNTKKIQNPLNMHGIPHGHTGHVRFLTSVELNAESHSSRLKGHTRLSFKGKEHPHPQPETVAPTKFMVISGGDGYEDFRSYSISESAGKDDSTNHLLSWQV